MNDDDDDDPRIPGLSEGFVEWWLLIPRKPMNNQSITIDGYDKNLTYFANYHVHKGEDLS